MDEDLALREPGRYRHWTEERIRFADLDAVGHVNNTAFGVYCESARVALVADLGFLPGRGALDWVLAKLTIEFLAPAHYPGTVRIGTRPLRIGRSSLALGQGLFLGEACIATARAVLVCVERASGRPRPIPDPARAGLEALMAD